MGKRVVFKPVKYLPQIFFFKVKHQHQIFKKTLPEELFHLNLDISHYCQKYFQPWCHLNGLIDALLKTNDF